MLLIARTPVMTPAHSAGTSATGPYHVKKNELLIDPHSGGRKSGFSAMVTSVEVSDTLSHPSTGPLGSVHSLGAVDAGRIVTGSVAGIHSNRSPIVGRSCRHIYKIDLPISL